uniref:5'-nucleotidase n=1 Tax=wastewater metagenome TaxID=527639 RepID=A0A0A8KXH1_9ZZZZ
MVGAVFVFCSGCALRRGCTEQFSMEIAHTNDIHAQVEPFNKYFQPCSSEDKIANNCFGGMARVITAVKKLKEANPDLILVDAGDIAQGSFYFRIYKEKLASWYINQIGYDALTFGNHDFDEGAQYVVDMASLIHAPYVSANIDASKNAEIDPLIKPYVILEREGQKIGVIGAITEEAANLMPNMKGLVILPLIESIQKQVNELEAQGVNKIVLISHVGLGVDRELARELSGLDVIVGGHTHSLLSNNDSKAEGPYPIIEKSARGEPVAVVTDYSRANYIGKLRAYFDNNGVLKDARGEPIVIDALYCEDEQAASKIHPWKETLKPYYEKVVGEAQDAFIVANDICRLEECSAGNMLADVLMWAAKDSKPDFAVINGGSIRSTISQGPITLAAVYEALPFQSTVSTFKLNGTDVLEMLEVGVSRSESKQNDGTGRFLQVSGLQFSWDANRPAGQRIGNVLVAASSGKFVPLDKNKIYSVASVDFIRRGGDGFDILKERAIEPYDFGPVLSEAFIAYLESHPKISAKLERRITKY